MRNSTKFKTSFIFVFVLAICLSTLSYAQNQTKIESIIEGFNEPPNEAKPRVWWHWMNGNISKDGIKKDLEWMHRIGIGGFQNFDANLTTPKIVEERLTYMTPKWKDAFKFTTQLADSLKLEMAIAASPGWSETGGPWVEPKDAMKKIVWSQSKITGGKKYKGNLHAPPTTSGTFQNAHFDNALSILGETPVPPEYYEDIAVIAYKTPVNDIPIKDLNPKITASSGEVFTVGQLTDGDVGTSEYLRPLKVGEHAWIQYEFNKPVTISSINMATGKIEEFSFGPVVETRNLEISDDGTTFRKVMDFNLGKIAHKTFTFAPITAKYYRFNFLTEEPPQFDMLASLFGIPPQSKEIKGTQIAEINLHTNSMVNNFEEKAAFSTATGLNDQPTPATPNPININEVIDITSKMKADGSLEWDAPKGDWTILRYGFSLTGRHNHPASPEATGLEVDKLDPTAVKAYIENYLDQYKDATGGLMGDKGGLGYIITDSWEAGTANWTGNMMEEFKKRRGYDLMPWMPALTGRIVKSSEESDRFLWDYRVTLAEMLKDYHYDVLTEVLHKRGMKRYSESHENNRSFIGDGMAIKSTADIPMSALWTPGLFNPMDTEPAIMNQVDIRESASTAHLYGQKYVAAESLTSLAFNNFAFYPESLKPTVDMELACGLNRFVIHTSAHQPVDDKFPGLSLGPFGQWFTRHETWAEQAKPWTTYLSRSSLMLQQGLYVADILYYYGEDSNITALFGTQLPDIPEGYSFDFINPGALTDLIKVYNGELTSPSGMKYTVLALDKNNKYMSLPILKKISELVKGGAIIIGEKPVGTPSLSDNKDEFNALANAVWNANNKNVYSNSSIGKVLNSLNVSPDFQYTKPFEDSKVIFVHRTLDDSEIYWVNSRKDRVEELTASFRVSGKEVEIWNPETGEIKKAAYKMEDGVTKVPLVMQPQDAFFVVFKGNTDVKEYAVAKKTENLLLDVTGPWQVEFQAERGAPKSMTLNTLSSWSENENEGVKYFSGTATYNKLLTLPKKSIKKDSEYWIDLGDVKNLAEVIVNGKSQQILWKRPFRANITSGLKTGDNLLEIKVTNVWANRLIGDLQPNVSTKITYTTMPFYQPQSPLLPSGLLGPVQILEVK